MFFYWQGNCLIKLVCVYTEYGITTAIYTQTVYVETTWVWLAIQMKLLLSKKLLVNICLNTADWCGDQKNTSL